MMKTAIVVLVVFGGLQSAFCEPNCESDLIEKCQTNQKRLYESENEEDINEEDLIQIYCKNSQALMDCIADPECKGDEINKYRYTNLEYNVMSQRTDLCPDLKTERLADLIPEALLQEHKFVDDLGGDKGSACARKIHWQCVKGLLTNLPDQGVSLCEAVKIFIDCYKGAMSGNEGCKSKLLEHFHHILTHLNQEVLKDVDEQSKIC